MKSQHRQPRAAAQVLALCCALGLWHSAAGAADAFDVYPVASFRLAFGHAPAEGALGMSLRSSLATAGTAPALVAFEVSPAAMSAQLAGVPVALRRFQVNQQDGGASAGPESSHQWMWWTGAGLAATAGLVSALSHGHSDNSNSGTATVKGCVAGGTVVGTSPGCVVSCPGGPPTACSPLAGTVPEALRAAEAEIVRDPAEDENGSMGGMGALLPATATARPAAME